MLVRLFRCGAASGVRFAHVGGTTMSIELSRIELTGPGGAASGQPEKSVAAYLRSGFVWFSAALIAGMAAWALVTGHAGKPAGSEPVPATAVVAEPAPSSVAAPSVIAFNPPTAEGEAIVPEATAPVDGLRISSQYWRRGGLGSKALVTFTLRNSNDYAVKDIAISCAFSRRDGSHLTDRSRVIPDTVNKRSRKTFARLHVGFVNVNASKAKCSLIAASPV
jgi:hypothetical protein